MPGRTLRGAVTTLQHCQRRATQMRPKFQGLVGVSTWWPPWRGAATAILGRRSARPGRRRPPPSVGSSPRSDLPGRIFPSRSSVGSSFRARHPRSDLPAPPSVGPSAGRIFRAPGRISVGSSRATLGRIFRGSDLPRARSDLPRPASRSDPVGSSRATLGRIFRAVGSSASLGRIFRVPRPGRIFPRPRSDLPSSSAQSTPGATVV